MPGPRKEPFRPRLARWLRATASALVLLVVLPVWLGWSALVEFGWPLWAGIATGVFTLAGLLPLVASLRRSDWRWAIFQRPGSDQ